MRSVLALGALLLASGAGAAQQYDVAERERDLFEVILPELRSGGEPLSQARLQWTYEMLIDFRYFHQARWPASEPFADVMDEVHAYAAEGAYDLSHFAWCDWNLPISFEESGRYGEIREVLVRTIGRYPLDEPYRPLLLYSLAHYERLCGRWESALAMLAEAEAGLAHVPAEHDLVPLARTMIGLERGAVTNELGLFEEAIPAVAQARALAEELDEPRVWCDAVIEELNLALALDDFERMASTYEEAQEHASYSALGVGERTQLALRVALGRAEYERMHPQEPAQARALLEDVLARGVLPTYETRLALVWLADRCLEHGDVDAARSHLATLVVLFAGSSWCGDGLPDRLEVAATMLAARIALLADDLDEVPRLGQLPAGGGDDDVVLDDARAFRRTLFDDVEHEHAGVLAEPQVLANQIGHRAGGQPDPMLRILDELVLAGEGLDLRLFRSLFGRNANQTILDKLTGHLGDRHGSANHECRDGQTGRRSLPCASLLHVGFPFCW